MTPVIINSKAAKAIISLIGTLCVGAMVVFAPDSIGYRAAEVVILALTSWGVWQHPAPGYNYPPAP